MTLSIDPCATRGHLWHYVSDWEGDPALINGVHECGYWECSECGETSDERPEGVPIDDDGDFDGDEDTL